MFHSAFFGASLDQPEYLLVIEVVDEDGEAPDLVLHAQRQHGNVADEHRVKEPRHLQIVAGSKRLKKTPKKHAHDAW